MKSLGCETTEKLKKKFDELSKLHFDLDNEKVFRYVYRFSYDFYRCKNELDIE